MEHCCGIRGGKKKTQKHFMVVHSNSASSHQRNDEIHDALLYLLAHAERLRVKMLDELDGHLVRVVRVAVYVLLLQEIDFQSRSSDVLLGRVEVVDADCKRETNKQVFVVQGLIFL